MTSSSSRTSLCIGGACLLGVALVALKLGGVIDWSWWWITAPFWGGLLLLILLIVLFAFATGPAHGGRD